MTSIRLTEEQKSKIREEMDEQVQMLSDEEVECIASQLNEHVDVPFISEQSEQTILFKMVRRIDRLLYQHLPNEIYGLVKIVHDGISDDDAEKLKNVLASRLNKQVDFPYVPEWVEHQIFEFVIDLIITAMRRNFSINEIRAVPAPAPA